MATTVGSIEFRVTADGTHLRRTLRREATVAGALAGRDAARAFNIAFNSGLNRSSAGRIAAMTRALGGLASVAGKVGGAFGGAFNTSSEGIGRLGGAMKGLGNATETANRRMGRASRLMRGHVARTIAAWTTLVLIIGEGTASLGSGVSASLTGLISTLGVGLVGAFNYAGAAALGFGAQLGLILNAFRFMEEESLAYGLVTEKIANTAEDSGRRFAAAWAPALTEFLATFDRLLGTTEVIDAMAASTIRMTEAFTGLLNGPSFTRFMEALGDEIPRATANIVEGIVGILDGMIGSFAAAAPYLESITATFNEWATEWGRRMSEAAANGELDGFFERVNTSLIAIFRFAGSVGNALMTLFNAGSDSGARMLDTLTDLFKRWDDWMKSVEGSDALANWFANGERVFDALLDLAGDLGRTLGELVTNESIDRLIRFMDVLGDALGPLGELLELMGRSRSLELFAQLLESVGKLLQPFMQALAPVADMIGRHIVLAVEALGIAFSFLQPFMIPVQVAFEILNRVMQAVYERIQPFIDILGEVQDELLGTGDSILAGLNPAIDALADAIVSMLPTPEEFANFIRNDLIPAIRDFATWLTDVAGPAIEELARWIRDYGVPAAQEFWQFFTDNILPLGGLVVDALGRAGDAFETFSSIVRGVVDVLAGPVNFLTDMFNNLFGSANSAIGAARGAQGATGSRGGPAVAMASGGVLTGPRYIRAGEAGPEAIVPLNRNLSQVDPSVRAISAILQGKSSFASGGIVGAKGLSVSPGAIVVQGAGDPYRAAVGVVNRLAERFA